MISGVAPPPAAKDAFIERGEDDSDADEEADEETDEVEADEEAEVEEEEESEDLALLQISEEEEEEEESDEEADEEAEEESDEEAHIEDESDEEAASEWTTPLYSLAETAATTSTSDASNDENGDFQTPQYVDGVYQTTGEEEMTDEEQTETDAGTADSSEPTFFESEATVNSNDETEWTTPEYSEAKAEVPVAEPTAFLEVSASEGWTTPTYTDASESSGKKEYARVIVPAEEEEEQEEEASLIEQAAESEVKFFTPRYIRSRGGRGRVRLIFHTPRRYRASDAIVARPRWNRHGHHTAHRAMARVIAGGAYRAAEHAAYDRLETYCSTRLPEAYGRYCRPILRNFRHITEGLRYGDRVGQVCMQVNLCKKTSYIAKSPHVRHGVW